MCTTPPLPRHRSRRGRKQAQEEEGRCRGGPQARGAPPPPVDDRGGLRAAPRRPPRIETLVGTEARRGNRTARMTAPATRSLVATVQSGRLRLDRWTAYPASPKDSLQRPHWSDPKLHRIRERDPSTSAHGSLAMRRAPWRGRATKAALDTTGPSHGSRSRSRSDDEAGSKGACEEERRRDRTDGPPGTARLVNNAG